MTTTKHDVAPRRKTAPAARHPKRPAPALVAGLGAPAPLPAPRDERLFRLLGDFAQVDALLAGAEALLASSAPPCPGLDPVRRAIAQAASLADEARDRLDECALGRLDGALSAHDALRSLMLQAHGAGALLAAAGKLLEATDWEASLPLVRAFPLLDLARDRCEAIAASLQDAMHAAFAAQVAA